MAEEKRTEISSLGEFGLIHHLTKDIKIKNASTVKGVGDDAAVINNNGKLTIITTDLLLEGIHFDLMYVPLKHLGYKAVVVNLSDIYAMNGQPKQITVSIGLSNRFSVESVEEIYKGIYLACEKYGVDVVGGDTSTSLQGLVISITAIGEGEEGKIVYRNTAKKDDLLCVSGDLGGAFVGLQILEREKRIFLEHPEIQPDLESQSYIIGRQLKPEARKDIIEFFTKENISPTAMIDISDGLSSETLHLTTAPKLGAIIYEDKIPIHNDTYNMALKFNLDPTTCALSGGEDYELLFTINPNDFSKIQLHPDISVIGKITDLSEGVKLRTKGGNTHDIVAQGWNAFKKTTST